MAINLASLLTTAVNKPPRIVLHGTHGVGKSTFASQAPKPVFLQTEDGLDALNVNAFPKFNTFGEFVEAIEALKNEQHNFETVVLDSADWLETLIHRQVADDNKVKSIEMIGFGKGYIFALDIWNYVLREFDYLRNEKEMQVILLAHTQIKRFDDPLTDSYDRYMLDMHRASAATISEWCDILLFANYDVYTTQNDVGFNQKKTKATGSGRRALHTAERPGWIAKSRFPLPESLDMTYGAFEAELSKAMNPT